MNNSLIPAPVLQNFASDLLFAMSCPRESAEKIAASLLSSDIRGINTHGVALLPMYAKMISDGAIDPLASTSVTHKTDCIISVDGHDGFGQLVGKLATETGIEAAQKHGMAMVGISNASHLGRLGEWAEQAAAAGLVFSAFSNTSGGALNVTAFGGHEKKLSTNPIAFAVPAFGALPFNIIVDFATSQVSGALVQKHARTGEALHPDWAITASGAVLTDAKAFMAGGGALLPLGGRTTGHKGYALALVAELLGGIAGGQVVGQQHPQWFSNAAMFSFLDPLQFLGLEELQQRINSIAAHLSEENVRLPGQGAYQQRRLAEKQGINLPPYVLTSLMELAGRLKVQIPDAIATLMTGEDDTG